VVVLAGFVVHERRTAHPLVRLGIFRTRSLSAANGVMLAVAGGMFAVFFFATLYVQQILGLSPVESGVGFLPLTAGIVVAAGAAQQLIGRLGVRAVALTGMMLAALGLFALSFASADGSYVADVLPGILIMGFGLGLTFVPLTLIATTNVAAQDAGLASGLFNTSQQIGGALGLAVLSTIAVDRTDETLQGLPGAPNPIQLGDALVSGFKGAFLAGAVLLLAGLALLLTMLKRRDLEQIPTDEPLRVPA